MTSNEINALFDGFANKKVLIIGDVMIDAYLWGKVERISPEAPVPVIAVAKKDQRLGGAANVARNVANLGGIPMLCSVIGTGKNAEDFSSILKKANISDEWLVKSGHRPTTIKTRVVAGHQQMLRIDEETTQDLNQEEFELLKAVVEKAILSCDILVFEDYEKGVLKKESIAEFIALAKAHGKTILVDPKKKNFLHYKGATVFKPNLKELQEGLNISFPSEFDVKEIEKAAAILREKLEAETAMITLSENGVFIGNEDESHHIPAHKRDIFDVSGAGDTVIAICALLLASDVPIRYVAEIANLGGGLVCEKVGVVPIDKESLRKEALQILA